MDWGSKILSMIGVKNKLIGKHGIKIWGQPNLKLNKSFVRTPIVVQEGSEDLVKN